MLRRLPLTFLTALALVTACTNSAAPAPSDSPEAGGTWTVLLYSMADTNLEPFMVEDVNEWGEVGSSEHANFVALVDRSEEYGDDDLLDVGGFEGAKLLRIEEDHAEELDDLGEINTGDPDVLSDFIVDGLEEHPADQVALVLSDHGAAWPGVGPDDSAGHDVLTLEEMREGIADGLEGAGIEKLDLLGFDACLMATYEVASTLAPVADRLVASQELEPGHGWDYGAFEVLTDAPGTPVDELAEAILDGFSDQAEDEGTESQITLSNIDLTQMEAVDEALADFSQAVVERGSVIAPAIGRTRAQTLGFGRSPDPNVDTHMADLGTLVSQIGVEALDVSDQADALVRALDDAVVDSVEGPATSAASGLSIYFPPQETYFNAEYGEVTTDGDWNDFLSAYYFAGGEIARPEQPSFSNAGGEAETFFDEDGLHVVGTFEGASTDTIAEARIRYGRLKPNGNVTFLGDEPAQISDDGSGRIEGVYDLTQLTLSDTEFTTDAYLSLDVNEDAEVATVDVPMAYFPPGDTSVEAYTDVLLQLTIDGEGDITNEVYFAHDPEAGTFGELYWKPKGIIVPQVHLVRTNGIDTWEPGGIGLFANLPELTYDFRELRKGRELFVVLEVTDFGGNTASVSATVTIP